MPVNRCISKAAEPATQAAKMLQVAIMPYMHQLDLSAVSDGSISSLRKAVDAYLGQRLHMMCGRNGHTKGSPSALQQ